MECGELRVRPPYLSVTLGRNPNQHGQQRQHCQHVMKKQCDDEWIQQTCVISCNSTRNHTLRALRVIVRVKQQRQRVDRGRRVEHHVEAVLIVHERAQAIQALELNLVAQFGHFFVLRARERGQQRVEAAAIDEICEPALALIICKSAKVNSIRIRIELLQQPYVRPSAGRNPSIPARS